MQIRQLEYFVAVCEHLKLGYIKGYEKTFLPDVLAEFHTRYPNISLSLYRDNVADLYDGIFDGSLDLIFNILYSFDDISFCC